ncbi:hypothetical protein D3C73_1526650 [compost metagenome]
MGDRQQLYNRLEQLRHIFHREKYASEEQQRERDEARNRPCTLRRLGKPCYNEADGHEGQRTEYDEQDQ